MRRIGRVLHVARSGELVLRSESDLAPRIGDKAYGSDLREVGVISDVFGPAASPFVAIRPSVEDPSRLVGEALYVKGRGRSWKGR